MNCNSWVIKIKKGVLCIRRPVVVYEVCVSGIFFDYLLKFKYYILIKAFLKK